MVQEDWFDHTVSFPVPFAESMLNVRISLIVNTCFGRT